MPVSALAHITVTGRCGGERRERERDFFLGQVCDVSYFVIERERERERERDFFSWTGL